ncbi:hypothetical protein T484DRAFT_1797884, partial [Baffinella frigidus]
YYFAQEAQFLDPSGGRAYFAAAEHDGGWLVLVGGVTPSGFANTTLVTSNGTIWEEGSRRVTEFSPRVLLAAEAWQGALWVLGGRDETGMLLNDVWKLPPSASEWWAPRHSHVALAFQDRLWVVGGASEEGGGRDVWHSRDGVTWVLVTRAAPFNKREGAADGVTWTLVTRAAPFAKREGAAGAVFNSRMWIYGGAHQPHGAEVWASTDGLQWILMNRDAPWGSRVILSGVVFDGRLWVVGGNNGTHGHQDVWSSLDGAAWERASPSTALSPTAQFGGRFGAVATAYKGRMLFIGGSESPCDANATSCGCHAHYASCSGNDVWADAFQALTFPLLEAASSSSVLLADNLLSFSLTLDADMPPGSTISVGGLAQFAVHTPVVVQGPSAPLVRRGAVWGAAVGEVVMTLDGTLHAGERSAMNPT